VKVSTDLIVTIELTNSERTSLYHFLTSVEASRDTDLSDDVLLLVARLATEIDPHV